MFALKYNKCLSQSDGGNKTMSKLRHICIDRKWVYIHSALFSFTKEKQHIDLYPIHILIGFYFLFKHE